MENNIQNNEQNVENKTAETIKEAAKTVGKAGLKVAGKGAQAAVSGIFGALTPLIAKIAIFTAIAAALGGAATAVVSAIKEANALKIEDTPNIVEKIKQISEFTTYTYIEEFVIKHQKAESKEASMLHNLLHKDAAPDSLRSEIVIITRGVVKAGYDLAKIGANDLSVRNDTIAIKLPGTEIFDVIINPSDNDVFIEEGKWSHEEITALQVDCKNKLLDNAVASGILENAEKKGREKLESLFKTFGFTVVELK